MSSQAQQGAHVGTCPGQGEDSVKLRNVTECKNQAPPKGELGACELRNQLGFVFLRPTSSSENRRFPLVVLSSLRFAKPSELSLDAPIICHKLRLHGSPLPTHALWRPVLARRLWPPASTTWQTKPGCIFSCHVPYSGGESEGHVRDATNLHFEPDVPKLTNA